jgi:hypothetical protein
MVNRDFPVEVTKGSDRERVAELTRASAFFTLNDVAKRLGTVMSNPQISGVTDPSAASVGFEMSIPTAEEACAVREIHPVWDKRHERDWRRGRRLVARKISQGEV